MRLLRLFLRSRRAGWCLVWTSFLATLLAGVAWRRDDYPASPGMVEARIEAPFLLLAALASACMIGVCCTSPFGHVERIGYRSIRRLRLAHIGGLVLVTTGVNLAALYVPAPDAAMVLIRDTWGFTGMALMTAVVVGAPLSWLLPVGSAMVSFFVPRTGGVESLSSVLLAWPLLGAEETLAVGVSCAWLVLGTVAFVVAGDRRQ